MALRISCASSSDSNPGMRYTVCSPDTSGRIPESSRLAAQSMYGFLGLTISTPRFNIGLAYKPNALPMRSGLSGTTYGRQGPYDAGSWDVVNRMHHCRRWLNLRKSPGIV